MGQRTTYTAPENWIWKTVSGVDPWGTGHQEHPFIALVTPGTTQTQGDVYAMHFVYSGNFLGQVEVSQHDMIRMTMGIHSYEFGWKLTPGQSFQAPEVVLTYSSGRPWQDDTFTS